MNTEVSRIMVLDDESKILKLIVKIFNDLPIHITTANTGEEGLKIIKNSKSFAVIISDYYMGPGMNGGEFLKLVAEYSPKTIRILMTGGIDRGSLVESVANGEFEGYSIKPFLVDNFIDQVQRSIQEYENI